MRNRETYYSPTQEETALNGYISRRARGFGMTLVVMGLSFGLYYLGLFGGVSGPLNGDSLGETLAGLGVTRLHLVLVLSAAFVCALSWNWVFNLVCRVMGRRMTCAKPLGKNGRTCGALVRVVKLKDKKTGQPVRQYLCSQGHKLDQARFRPVEKGVLGHTVWLMVLVFLLILAAS